MQTNGKRHHGRAGKPKIRGTDYQETGVVKEWIGRIIGIIALFVVCSL